MKVCTDSCLLGAYANVNGANTILDIGTGTGLLALMAAQRSHAQIDALEIDDLAAAQAKENITDSPWATRINLYHQSLQCFEQENKKFYDVILCNPPFYIASQKSPDQARNIAMHSHELSFEEIIRFCAKFLHETGKLYLLLPPSESLLFQKQALLAQLFLQKQLCLYTTPTGKHIRNILVFSRNPAASIPKVPLAIRNTDQTYTEDFIKLLQEYYLIF